MTITNKKKDILSEFCNYSGKINIIFQSNIVIAIIICSLICLYIILSLLPILHSGYYSDDMVNSSLRGQIALDKMSYFNYTINFIDYMAKAYGRFVPVSIFTLTLIFYYFHNIFLYKAIILLLIIINTLLFGLFTKKIFKDSYVSYLFMLGIPLFFQFRLYHDPILSFAGQLQFFFCYLFGSLIFLQYYLETGNKTTLIASLVLFNVSLYSYEISAPLTLLYFIIIYEEKRNLAISLRKSLPFIYSLLIAIFINLLFRFIIKSQSLPEYGGITIHFNIGLIIRTLFMQIYSALPLSYFLTNPSHLFNHNILILLKQLNDKDIFLLVIFNILTFNLAKRINIANLNWRKSLSIGLCLLILPAIPIALSAKYQQEFNWYGGWGIGYIPVYIQYYGALMVLAVIIILINKLIKSKNKITAPLILSMGMSLIIIINLHTNRAVVDKANIDLYYGRETLEKALDNNILKDIPENSTILVKYDYKYNPYPSYVFNGLRGWIAGYDWDNKYFFYLHSKKRVNVVHNINQLDNTKNKNQLDELDFVNKNIFFLEIKSYHEYFDNRNKEGYVVLGKLNYVQINNTATNKSKMNIKFCRVWHEPNAKEPVAISKFDYLKTIVIDGTETWTMK